MEEENKTLKYMQEARNYEKWCSTLENGTSRNKYNNQNLKLSVYIKRQRENLSISQRKWTDELQIIDTHSWIFNCNIKVESSMALISSTANMYSMYWKFIFIEWEWNESIFINKNGKNSLPTDSD